MPHAKKRCKAPLRGFFGEILSFFACRAPLKKLNRKDFKATDTFPVIPSFFAPCDDGFISHDILAYRTIEGDYRHALRCYQEAAELYPDNAIFYSNAANCHLKLEEWEEALTAAKRSTERNEASIKAHYQQALALFHLREYKTAIVSCNKILKMEPTNTLAKSKRSECEKKSVQLQFEEAIHVPELVLSQALVDSIAVNTAYEGPKLEKRENVTMTFVHELTAFLKQKKSLHRKYALKVMFYAFEIFSSQPSLIHIDFPPEAKMTVCGDLHGQYLDLLNIFALHGWPSPTHFYLFNGDFVDRGPASIEVILTLLSLKVLYPESFFMARGNHESCHVNKIYGFEKDVKGKYDEDMFKLFQQVFNAIPLCHVIQNKLFVTHGGLSENPKVSLDEIKNIDRYHDPSDDDSLMHHLLWADPRPEDGIGPSPRGTSISFGPDITKAFLEYNHLEAVIRSHEYQEEGYSVDHDGKCITIFSAPNYMNAKNKGAVIQVTYDGQMTFESFSAV